MKKGLIYFFFLAISGFYSCSDNIENRIEGQWQLKTIEENGVISQVDTVFYCFMGGRVFSYTLLINPEEAMQYYGYIEDLSDRSIQIGIDDNYYPYIPEWDAQQRIFDIRHVDGKFLTLYDSSNNKVYSFNKY